MSRGGGYAGRNRVAARRRRGIFGELVVALMAVAALGYVAIDQGYVSVPGLEALSPAVTAQPDLIAHRFAVCAGAGGTCVIDGDTIRIEGQSIRIADIDTPEVRGFACPAEKALGDRATLRMTQLLNEGGFSMRLWDHRDADQYGRKLRVITREGQSLGMVLVAEGLARPWDGARRGWC